MRAWQMRIQEVRDGARPPDPRFQVSFPLESQEKPPCNSIFAWEMYKKSKFAER